MKTSSYDPFRCGVCWAESCWGCALNRLQKEDEEEEWELEGAMNKTTIAAMTSSGKDDWETPAWLFEKLNAEFHFTLDPCCTHETAKCRKHYTPEENGLLQDWQGETVFCNPPYSRKTRKNPGQIAWVKKCMEEGRKPGTTVVALLPARTDTELFHRYIYGKAEIRFLKGRVNFIDHGREAGRPLFGTMICVWRGDRDERLDRKSENRRRVGRGA